MKHLIKKVINLKVLFAIVIGFWKDAVNFLNRLNIVITIWLTLDNWVANVFNTGLRTEPCGPS